MKTCGCCAGSSIDAKAPNPADLDLQGLNIAPGALEELLTVSPQLWQEEFAGIDKYFREFGDRIPESLRAELKSALDKVHSSQV